MAELNAVQEPLFLSAYDALAFAFRFNAQQYAPTPVAKLMRGHIGSGKGLVGVDGAAQAGLIRAMIEPLPEWEKAAIAARFAIDRKELYGARNTLIVPAMASLGTGVHNRRMVDELVQKFFGKRVKIQDVAARYNQHRATVGQKWGCIKRSLAEIEVRAIDRAESIMVDRGLC